MVHKIWLTKYALSEGVTCHEVTRTSSAIGPSTFVYLHGFMSPFYLGHDCFWTAKEACAKAEGMRLAKIASLRKSLAKLEKLSFKSSAQQNPGDQSPPECEGNQAAKHGGVS